MATGLLVLGIHNSTRLLTTYLVGLDKGVFRYHPVSDRPPTPATPTGRRSRRRPARVDARLPGPPSPPPSGLTGANQPGAQQRERHSCRWQTRIHARARGETVELAARSVTVSALEVLDSRRGSGLLTIS
jgi:hypothetical protein